MLFENFEADITRIDNFVKDQHEKIMQITEQANGLIEHFKVLKIAQEMIFGFDHQEIFNDAQAISDGSEGDDFIARGNLASRNRRPSLGRLSLSQEFGAF